MILLQLLRWLYRELIRRPWRLHRELLNPKPVCSTSILKNSHPAMVTGAWRTERPPLSLTLANKNMFCKHCYESKIWSQQEVVTIMGIHSLWIGQTTGQSQWKQFKKKTSVPSSWDDGLDSFLEQEYRWPCMKLPSSKCSL